MFKFIKKIIRRDWGLVVITSVFIASLIYMLPIRNEIYGDSWTYMQNVRYLLQTGVLKVSELSTATLIFQIYYGAIFAKLFGFSQMILNISTFLIFYPGLIAFYLLLKRLGLNVLRSTIFTVVLFSFPYVFFLAFSFLTYIPAMSLTIISLFFYVKAIQEESNLNYFLGSFFSSLGFLTRQDVAVIPAALFIIFLYKMFLHHKVKIVEFISAFGLPLLVFCMYSYWVSRSGNITIAQYRVSFLSNPDWLQQFLPIPLDRIMITNIYYAKYIQRPIFYMFHIIGFLTPVFLIFKIDIRKILVFIKKNFRMLFFSTLIFLAIFGVDYVFRYSNGPEYQIDPPTIISAWAVFYPRITQDWPKIIFFSAPIWIPVMGISASKFFQLIFKKKKKGKSRAYVYLIIGFSFLCLVYYLRAFLLVYKAKIPYSLENFRKIIAFKNLFWTSVGGVFLYNTWLVPTMILLVFILLVYLFFHFKINKQSGVLKLEKIFISLVFINFLAFMIFITYYQWPHYTTTLIPFVVIMLAFVSRKWKISLTRTLVILSIISIFSIGATKKRYDFNSFEFELGNKLVERGIAPIDIAVADQSWIPWWYYDQTLKEAIKKAKGNKYDIDTLGPWQGIRKSNEELTYFFEKVPLDFKPEDNPGLNIILDTGPQYSNLFSKVRYIVVKK